MFIRSNSILINTIDISGMPGGKWNITSLLWLCRVWKVEDRKAPFLTGGINIIIVWNNWGRTPSCPMTNGWNNLRISEVVKRYGRYSCISIVPWNKKGTIKRSNTINGLMITPWPVTQPTIMVFRQSIFPMGVSITSWVIIILKFHLQPPLPPLAQPLLPAQPLLLLLNKVQVYWFSKD